MMVAVLLGALSLGACVDDNESASVTNIRDAKAEQLRSLATLNEAKAEAELIRANAEAALKNAKAAYEQAQADKEQFELQKAQEEYALAIENIRIRYQIQLANLQKQLLEAQQDLEDVDYQRVSALFTRYYLELDKLTGYQRSLVEQQSQLARLEANIVSAQEWAEYNNLWITNEIASIDAQLAVLTDDAYDGLDVEELQAQADAKYKEYQLAEAAFVNDPTSVALQETVSPLNTAYAAVQAQDELLQDIFDASNSFGYSVVNYTRGTYYDYNAYTAVGYSAVWLNYGIFCYENLRIDESGKLNVDRDLAQRVETANDRVALCTAALGKDTDTPTTKYDSDGDGTADALTAYAQLAAANADLTAANAMGEDDVLNNMTKEQAIDAANQAIKNAEMAIAIAKDNLASAQDTYNTALAQQTEFNDAIEAFDIDTYNTAVATYIELCEAQDEAESAWEEAKAVVNELYYEWRGLDYLANNSGLNNINEEIARLEAQKAEYQAQLVDNTDVINAETALQLAEDTIEKLQSQIEAQTAIVESCRAALEAALGSDSGTDTPAEEETPAA